MKILSLDTSTECCSAALWIDGELRCEDCQAGQRHSELLLPMIDRLLLEAGVGLEDCDAVAFGEGPGSFTGLRIACGVAQGLAFGAGIPVIGVGTLLAMAQATRAAQVLCCLDARMHELYAAAYRRASGRWETVLAPGLYSSAALPPLPADGWTGCGNGFSVYGDALVRVYGGQLGVVRPEILPHAREIAVLAAEAFAVGGGKPASEALPVYIRDKVALTVEEQH